MNDSAKATLVAVSIYPRPLPTEHDPGCPMTWPDEPRGIRRACWCHGQLPEDYELPGSEDDAR
jgi:hypothetical protein